MLNRTACSRIVLCFFLLVCLMPPSVYAHPMGNFSVNHYGRISIENGAIYIRYLIDMAEIPTYQEIQDSRIVPIAGDPSLPAYLHQKGESLKRGILISVNNRPLLLHQVSEQISFSPGAGGLPTMKMSFLYQADPPIQVNDGDLRLNYADSNYAGRAGWKEIVVRVPGSALLETSASQTDRSRELTDYPTDLLNSPPQDLAAQVLFESSALTAMDSPTAHPERAKKGAAVAAIPIRATQSAASKPTATQQDSSVQTGIRPIETVRSEPLKANKQATPRNAFTELIAVRRFGLWFLLTAALIAAGLGALHALEPGHGKTIVAAYLVGTRGTARHAVLLGVTVTIAHTVGVFALGAITLYGSRYIVPEHLYPWLGAISGLTIAGIGVFMILRHWTGEDGEHSHQSGEAHSDWFFLSRGSGSRSPEPAASAQISAPVTLYQLLALGITGGIIPCPAALVVLLSAFSLHRVGFGLFLILCFSIGLASVLIAVGLSMVYAKRFVKKLRMDGPLATRWLPIASSTFMVILGLAISIRASLTIGVGPNLFSKERLGPFLFVVALGLFLGMRHSTDPDHVVAVSTFVSKEFTVRRAAVIGMMWGLGHTLTIFLVGSAIIIFGVVIPPRMGLSMEFSVAVMLILLGVLNLTGSMRWINERFSKPVSSLDVQDAQVPDSPGRRIEGSIIGRTVGRFGWYQCLRPLVVGIVHGLAGSAAVALLVLSTIHNPSWATAYLLVFGAGTMVGMMVMTTVMVVPLAYSGRRFANLSKYLTTCSGIVSVCFGTFLVYQIGYLQGLFSKTPRWTPH